MFAQLKFFILSFTGGIIITMILGFSMYFIIDKEKERLIKCDEYIINIHQLEQEVNYLKSKLKVNDEIH